MRMPYIDINYIIYVLPALLIAMLAQWKVKSTYQMYSRVENESMKTGYQVAREILDRNGLHHVQIESVSGELSDHYDPRTKVVRLSSSVYHEATISSMSIAAHEVGHAIQHAEGYVPLKVRSAIVPVLNFSSKFVWVFIILGVMIAPEFAYAGIAIFSLSLLFQLVTLPVEFNASSRALVQLQEGIALPNEVRESKAVLSAAAFTYVAATLVSLGELLRIIAILGRSNDN